jgi:uncharacterized membrane protein
MRSRARIGLAALLASSALSLGLLAFRILLRSDATYGFLAWNLFLAWIPLLLAIVIVRAWGSGLWISAALLLVLWLLFFPNAPYVVTDFVHLRDMGGMPRWFDVLLLSSFATTALALGFASLYLVQNLIRATFGAAWSWASALTVIGLSGIGIYLGRVYQLNSWDVLEPGRFRAALTGSNVAQDHRALLTVLLTCLLAAAYTLGRRFADRAARITR